MNFNTPRETRSDRTPNSCHRDRRLIAFAFVPLRFRTQTRRSEIAMSVPLLRADHPEATGATVMAGSLHEVDRSAHVRRLTRYKVTDHHQTCFGSCMYSLLHM